EDYQSFLANSLEEAVSGAIKLARYDRSLAGQPSTGLVLDPSGCLEAHFRATVDGSPIEWIPGLVIADTKEASTDWARQNSFGFVVLVTCTLESDDLDPNVLRLFREQQPGALVIVCVDRARLAQLRSSAENPWRQVVPDIVIFDETFTNHAVPFGA